MYADDTLATVKWELWPEIEVKLMFEEMKLNRLKVNEDKTGLILMGSRTTRRRILQGGGRRILKLAGEEIKKPRRPSHWVWYYQKT